MVNLFHKSYEIVEKLDSHISRLVEVYEKKNYGIKKLRHNIYNVLEIFSTYNFDIKDFDDKFDLDYIVYINDEYILNINIEFFQGGKHLFFKYNFIILVSTDGVIIEDITNKCVNILAEE